MNFGLPRTVRKFFNVSETLGDRKSTRLNSSHSQISYAVFCLKKKKKKYNYQPDLIFNNMLLKPGPVSVFFKNGNGTLTRPHPCGVDACILSVTMDLALCVSVR